MEMCSIMVKFVYGASALRPNKAPLRSIIFVILFATLIGCAPKPYDVEVTPQPVSQEMYNAMLQEEDASILSAMGDWKVQRSSQVTSDWAWSNPESVVTDQLQLVVRDTLWMPVEQTLIRYASPDVAHSVWAEVQGYKIENKAAHAVTKEIDLFSAEELPISSADNIAYRCERYYDDPSWNSCIARMQFGQYFVHIRGDINGNELPVEQFLAFVQLADERMRVLLASESR